MGVVWWWLLGLSAKMAAKHRGNTTDGDEVVAKDTNALSLCVVCHVHGAIFFRITCHLKKKQKMEKRKSENPA